MQLITRKQAAERLSVSQQTIIRLGKSGKLTPIKMGEGKTAPCRYRLSEIEEMVNGMAKKK